MKKIKTLFKKNPSNLGRVIEQIDPANNWVFEFGIPTRKFDGIACAIINGELYKRYDVRKGKEVPEGAISCQEADELSGHHPHWVKCNESDKADKYHFEAFRSCPLLLKDGTYELCGPKINGNKERLEFHMLIEHGSFVIEDLEDYSYDTIKAYLESHDIEGIVFHHSFDPELMCKIRKKDFGIKR